MAIVLGLGLAVLGQPAGFVVLVLGLATAAGLYVSTALAQRRAEGADPAPRDDGEGHKVTGVAHEGQRHMDGR